MSANSIQCYRAVRADQRANDLTIDAIIRDVLASVVSALTQATNTLTGWYSHHARRRQRRRHHYRRAVAAVSTQRLARDLGVAVVQRSQSPAHGNALIVHITGGEANSFAPGHVDQTTGLPPAHICAEAKHGNTRMTAS